MALLQRSAVKESRLQARLSVRYQEVLSTLHDTVHEFNKRLDKEQMRQLVELKEVLQQSHNECEELLQGEENRVQSHKDYLAKYTASGTDDVLPPFTDCYHNVEVRVDDSKGRLRADRKRILTLCVTVRSLHQRRCDAITECEEKVEARERERHMQLNKLLTEFVEALTKISYTSISASHVLAQRAIHTINEHLCKNHLGRKTLIAQLRSREILRQRLYSRKLADVYSASLELMLRSSLRWATTLLQTAHFRRPYCRVLALEQIHKLASNVKRDGSQFICNMAVIVQSLRRVRNPLPTEWGQICGGTLPDGWLRSFNGALLSPVFSVSPSELTVEWRVKANVLVRNTVLQCVKLTEEVKLAERQLCNEAESILTELHAIVQWACEPEEKEVEMLTNASVHSVEDVFTRFASKNTSLYTQFSTEVDNTLLPLLTTIRRESEWFLNAVETELRIQHATLDELLLSGPKNVLLTFQKVTDALQTTTTGALGFVRARFVELYEARKDHEDALRHVEKELAQNEEKLRRAATTEAAEVLFVEGLAIFERISAQHTNFHRHIVQTLQCIAQESPVVVERHCTALLQLIGLESEEACERRLEQERHEREVTTKKGSAKETVMEPESESEEYTIPPYPSISATNGELYYIVAPIAAEQQKVNTNVNVSPPQQRPLKKSPRRDSKLPSGKGKGTLSQETQPHHQQQQQQQQQRGGKMAKDSQVKNESGVNPNRSLPVMSVLPPSAFLLTYKKLLKDALHENGEAILLSPNSVEEWHEMLRIEVLNWMIHLRHVSCEHMQKQCTLEKSAIDVETNEILRHHRRRPATLQSEVYEGRLREIEVKQINKEACLARLRERVALFLANWSNMQDDDYTDNSETKLFEQFQEMEKMVYEVNSVNAIVLQEQNFSNLINSSIEARNNYYNNILSELSRQGELLEVECRSYLIGGRKRISVKSEEIQTSNNLTENNDHKEMNEILLQLQNGAVAVKEKITAEKEQYLRRIEAIKSSYSAAYEQNIGELQVLARIQEILSRFKVQLRSLTTLSTVSEGKIEETIKELEDKLATPAPFHDFSNTLQDIISRPYGATLLHTENRLPSDAGKSLTTAARSEEKFVDTTMTEERAREADIVLNERLAELTLETQRQIKSSDLAKVLRLLDNLREALYVRGRYLNCLQYGVEFFNIPQEDYIEPHVGNVPKATGEEVIKGGTATPFPSSQGRSMRKSRTLTDPGEAMASLCPTMDLPVVLPAEREVIEGIAAVKTQVSNILEQHFAVCPPPFIRRLPGMVDGKFEDVMNMCTRVCEQQQQHTMHHISQATIRYREQVQRVLDSVRKMPDYLNNAIYTISAMSLERRLATVFDVFAKLYGQSDALRIANERFLKVTLASNYNRDKLGVLCHTESTRQVVTNAVIEKFWGYALREMQEEATMHAAKSINVNNNFITLMRGIVLPENLKPADDETGGHHRGLRRLLRLKTREEERAKELQAQQQQQQGMKRERKLQETMPRRSSFSTTGGSKKLETSSVSVNAIEMSGGQLPLSSSPKIEYGRVPLFAFSPLDEFCASHPRTTVTLSRQETTSAVARVLLSSPTPSQQQQQQSSTTTNQRGKKEGNTILPTEDSIGTVPIIAPATFLNKEIAARTQQSVERFNESSMRVAKNTNNAFHKWTEQEDVWRSMWEAFIQRLKM